jgi:hypothetical protein
MAKKSVTFVGNFLLQFSSQLGCTEKSIFAVLAVINNQEIIVIRIEIVGNNRSVVLEKNTIEKIDTMSF